MQKSSIPALFLMTLILAACGGGSDSPSKLSQTQLNFNENEINLYINETPEINNLNGGSGSGELTYISANTNVVKVDVTTGVITIVGTGSSVVTATKSEDDKFLSASVSYTINIIRIEQTPLIFNKNSLAIFIDEVPVENILSGGDGAGNLVWSSSDTAVVAVEASSGELTLQAAGTVDISVLKESDGVYNETSTSYILTVSKYTQQSLTFEKMNVIGILNGPTIVNPLTGGSGTGVISYSSSDNSILTVGETTGLVKIIKPGKAEISAVKLEDKIYTEMPASYSITAVDIIANLDISLTADDTEISWPTQVGKIEVFRSTDVDCDINNYASCTDSSLNIISDPTEVPVIDDFIKINQSAFLTFQNEQYRSGLMRISAEVAPFPRRIQQQMINYAGKIWVFGGTDNSAGDSGNDTIWYNDIWSSEDGKVWKQEVEHAEFSARANHKVVEYDNALYMIGGEEGVGTAGALVFRSDVWKSPDGILWDRLTSSGPFDGGITGEAIVFMDKIFIIGGGDFTKNASIWSTNNGVDWVEELKVPPFGYREGHELFIRDNKLFLLGGSADSDSLSTEVWSTVDGINWVLETDNTGFTPRVSMHIIEFNDQLFMVGGHSFPDTHNTVYSSSDGINWSLSATSIILSMNQFSTVVEFKGYLWLYTGLDNGYIWRSTDGINWRTPISVELNWSIIPE